MGKSRVFRVLSDLNWLKWSVTYKGIIAGVIAGLLVVLYRRGIQFGIDTSKAIYRYLGGHPLFIFLWVFVIGGAGYVIYRLIRYEPNAMGSGIPQVEGIVLKGMKMKWRTVLAVRYLAGILGSFFGISVGREGPCIQIGASGAQAVAGKLCGDNRLEKNLLITAGASAGLSAAFNAPLSGIIFALEEVHRTFSPNILIAATSAALTSDIVSKYFFGLTPVLSYGSIPQLPMRCYPLLLFLGVIAGLVGAAANKGLIEIDRLYRKLPPFARPATALILALPCGLLIPAVLGGGQNLIKMSESAQAGIALLSLYLVVKLVFTCTSFGSGIPGGIFMPILSMGALTGCIFGLIVSHLGLSETYMPAFCVCAMAGAMASSVKAPVTSILLMVEMTGSLVHLLPVAAVAFIALLTSDLLKISPIYEVLLERMAGEGDGGMEKKRKNAIIEVPVEMGSAVAGRKIREILWPEGALVVALKRGETEIVPNGETEIIPGDYLIILSSRMRFAEMQKELAGLCQAE